MLENIKKIAESKGMSLRSIELICGFRNIYRWDEHTPSVDKVQRVAEVLGVTVDELLREEE